jgi:phospholipid/cholesterol/gamma-HCH transport system ATP-binding protein
MTEPDIILSARNISNRFGKQLIHDDISVDMYRGEIVGLVGGSGAGKSVLLRTLTGLHRPTLGHVTIRQQPLYRIAPAQRASLFGVLFQEGALFSSLTVMENIMLPMREHTDLTRDECLELAACKLSLVGLEPAVGMKYPSQLSGGMTKRASLARALALDPPLLFLDEPTAGLDPISATAFDTMIAMLNRTLGITIVMITHDLDSLFTVCDRVAMLVDRKLTIEPLESMLNNPHPWIYEYLHGSRAIGAQVAAEKAHAHGE